MAALEVGGSDRTLSTACLLTVLVVNFLNLEI